MQIENLSTDAETFTANAYLVNKTALVDVGADSIIVQKLDNHSLETIVITHSHHDHIENLSSILEEHNPHVYAYEPENLPVDAEKLDDGDTVTLGGADFRAYHTPGHRDDHFCLYSDADRILFSGDLIFPNGSFGRTDLDQGDRDTLITSIERIAGLDIQAMYPGHDQPTTDNVNEQIDQSLQAAKNREPKY